MSARPRNSGRGPPGKTRAHDGDRGGGDDHSVERRKDEASKDGPRREEGGKSSKSHKHKHAR